MMQKLLACVLALFATTVGATTFDAERAKALKGDYTAQRNVAYGYSALPYPGQDKNPTLACAWRIIILKSGNARVDATDTSNHAVYCGKLPPAEREQAEAQAASLLKQIK